MPKPQPRTRPATDRRRLTAFLSAPLVALLIAGCTTTTDDTATELPTRTGSQSTGQTEVITDELGAPWSIAFAGDTALISERNTGRILELQDGTTREIATIDGVAPGGEAGLLGLAVRDGYLYAYFTTEADNRINRYELTGEPGSYGLGPAETIFDGIPAARVHNGGRLAFGPDGMLYATTGDAENAATSQDLESTAGKILRLTPDGGIPEDNPFGDSPVYSYGHRNSQGIAWAADGTMYASEFGADTWDELNIIEPGGNYGWPEVEGIGGGEEYLDPVVQWEPADASPSGIAIVDGTVYVANLRGRGLHEVPIADPADTTASHVDEYGRLRDVVVAPDGTLWLLTNNTDGRGTPNDGDDRIISIPME